ncbi:hypothetical protein [Streptomyces griseorubiginosus]|uniref:hypothetical protein n=1 Tax=Streptomyces griseorubiginosus TaxID=67304 RepID=UPI002E8002A2|nr:hypothetical protein [Streptomyces griseorubiginosus]WUB41870.1 hypothetical protein OHN19_00440 [Streptomyces griseorubiginosus]WUB50390.1 hypothetical protein OG942_00435 [Streptomyces griseorubiginosus]
MPEIWIGLDVAARRRNWWWTAVSTLLFAGMAVATQATATTERWWWAGVVGAVWLSSLFYMINRGYGRTLLAPDRMQFSTFVTRRSIAWSEITKIEPRRHRTGSGAWWEVRVHRARGRSLAIPGIFASRRGDEVFERNLAVIREYWARAAALD